MENKFFLPLLFFSALLYSCRQQPNQETKFDPNAPRVVEANSFRTPANKLIPPLVISTGTVKNRVAGKPKIIPIISNVHPVLTPDVVPASASAINIPGQGRWLLPEIKAAINKMVPAFFKYLFIVLTSV